MSSKLPPETKTQIFWKNCFENISDEEDFEWVEIHIPEILNVPLRR